MRISVAFGLACLLVTMSPVGAQTRTSEADSVRKDDVRTTASRVVTGTVKSSSLDTVVVNGRDRGKDMEWTFAVEPTTDIRKGGKSIVAGDLKRGDAVQVRFIEQSGKATARSITVKGPSAAKKTKS